MEGVLDLSFVEVTNVEVTKVGVTKVGVAKVGVANVEVTKSGSDKWALLGCPLVFEQTRIRNHFFEVFKQLSPMRGVHYAVVEGSTERKNRAGNDLSVNHPRFLRNAP